MLYIIGDSHTHRLRKSTFTEPVKRCYWIRDHKNDTLIPSPSECIDTHCEKSTFNKGEKGITYGKYVLGGEVPEKERLKSEVIFSGHPGATGYTCTYTKGGFPCIKKEINEDTLVMPWFGYIDIKAHLPRTKNTEEAVARYIEQTTSFFKGYKMQFIEPLPQFINALGSGFPNYKFEERYPYYLEYLQLLRKYLSDYGLNKPISIEEILGTDKLDESYECHDCNDCLSPAFINHKLDHMKKEFNKKILDGIIDRVI